LEVTKPHLTSYQKDILFCHSRFTITEASTKVGKTHSHIIWLFGKSMELSEAHGYNYWWVAPVYNQAKIAFSRLKRNLIKYGVFRFNETSLTIHCPNGAMIVFKSAEKPDNLFGEDVYACVFDEAPRARPESWYALRSTLTATEAPCKLIGNFGGVGNWVHKLKEKALEDSNYSYFRVNCWDAVKEGILSKKEVEQAQIDLPEKIFKELYLAEPCDGTDQLISSDSIRDLFTNDFAVKGKKYLSIDVARFGKDASCVCLWNGLRLESIRIIQQNTITSLAKEIQELAKVQNIPRSQIIVDDSGVGGGLTDILKCKGFVSNAKAQKEKGKAQNYRHLKAQCYYKLAEYINSSKIFVSCTDDKVIRMLTEELEQVRMPNINDVNKLDVISKDEVKRTIGRSPDISDSLMMRMYFEISKTTTRW